MKKKLLFIPAIALGLLGMSCGLLSMNRSFAQAKAYSDADSYTKTADHFVASMHRNNALRDAYNGDDNQGDSTRASNVTISDMDHTSSIAWKVSVAKYSYDSFRNLKMGNKGVTIEGSAETEFAAIYDATGVGAGHYVSAMYSTTAISNIQDLFVTWGAQGGQLHESAFGDIFFLYKLADGDWTLIKSYNAGYGTGDRGTSSTWNHVVGNISNSRLNTAGVLGKNAQLAIAYDSGTDSTKNSFVCLHTLMVNRVASAKATMHYWDKGGADLELCTYITDTKANNSVKIAMFAYEITQLQVDGGVYEGVTLEGLDAAANFEYHNAKETNYYNQLAYLCGQAGVDLPKTPSSSNTIMVANKNNIWMFVVIGAAIIAITSGAALLVLKKKHQ